MRRPLLIKCCKGRKCIVSNLYTIHSLFSYLFSICLGTRKFRTTQQSGVSDDQSWPFAFGHVVFGLEDTLKQLSAPVNCVCLSVFWREPPTLQMEMQVGCIYD